MDNCIQPKAMRPGTVRRAKPEIDAQIAKPPPVNMIPAGNHAHDTSSDNHPWVGEVNERGP
jgi:hypothetical protein